HDTPNDTLGTPWGNIDDEVVFLGLPLKHPLGHNLQLITQVANMPILHQFFGAYRGPKPEEEHVERVEANLALELVLTHHPGWGGMRLTAGDYVQHGGSIY